MRNKINRVMILIRVAVLMLMLLPGCAGRPESGPSARGDEKNLDEAQIIRKVEREYAPKRENAEVKRKPALPPSESGSSTETSVQSGSAAPKGKPSEGGAVSAVVPRKRVLDDAIKRRIHAPALEGGPEKGQIVFNFDDADLYEVIKTLADLMGINYIVDPGVKGKVTIHTARKLKKSDLFSVFSEILSLNGLTAMKEGNLYRIVAVKEASRMPTDALFTLSQKDIPPMNRTIIQIIPLNYMSTQEMTQLITPFVSSGGMVVASVPTNTLVVVDKGSNILKILRLVSAFDVNVLDRLYYRFYPLEYLEAKEVVDIMEAFTESSGEKSTKIVRFIALERLNTLLAVSTVPDVFEKIRKLVHQIDVVDETVAPRIFIYFVKNGRADELATLLNNVLTGKETKTQKKKAGGDTRVPGNPFSRARVAEKKAEKKAAEAGETTKKTRKATASAKEGEGASVLMGEVTITPDEIRNALIIEATPSDHRTIEAILKKIDIMPRQVLIEATIAEITLDSSTQFGVEYALGADAAAGNASFMASLGEGGLQYSIGVTDKWYAELNALASKGKLNVISSPHVLASDNQEAKIDVSREIPLASGQTTVASGSTVSETTIEYRDTGVILSVTPHINDRGLVTMDVSEEVSNYDGNMTVGQQGYEYPVFSKRVVKTSLTVGHGQTIAIGGLIRDREKEETSGLPCLIDVPVVKYLTGNWSKETEKIELIVLITPRVVANMDDVEAVTHEFKQKVRSVMKQFYPGQ